VLHNHRAERIRLSGIDCPENGQAYGNRAKQAASAGTPHRPSSAKLIT
jgi:endonuclease YncB( thermonuclease family)